MSLTCDEITASVVPDRLALKEAFAKHYKAERDRSEKCLGEIVEAICAEADDTKKIKQVAAALAKHYSRS